MADATKAWQHLGWRPTRSSIDTIVADAWAWHLKDAQGFGKLSPSKSAEPGPPATFLQQYACILLSPGTEVDMENMSQDVVAAPDPSSVLSKAVARAAERMGISRAALAKILGVSAPTVTRLYNGEYKLDERRKEWELALLLVRVFRSLDSIVGNEQTARQWLNSQNRGLNGRPVELIRQTEGLVRVVHYLDASRGLV